MSDFQEGYRPPMQEVNISPPPTDSHIFQTDQSRMFIGAFHNKFKDKPYVPSMAHSIKNVPYLYFFSNDRLSEETENQLRGMKYKGDVLSVGAGGVGYRMWQQSSEIEPRGLIIVDSDVMITDVYVPLQIQAARSASSLAEYWGQLTGYPLGYLEKKLGRPMTYDDIRVSINTCEETELYIDKSGHINTDRIKKASERSANKEVLSTINAEYAQKLTQSKQEFEKRYHKLMDALTLKIPDIKPIPEDAFKEAFMYDRLMSSSYLLHTKNFPFTDPFAFAQWKAALTYQPITTICANIFNPEHMEKIGEIVRQRGSTIAAAFLSNVEEYTPPNFKPEEHFLKAFGSSIPTDKNALIYRVNIDQDGFEGNVVGHRIDKKSWKSAGLTTHNKQYSQLHAP